MSTNPATKTHFLALSNGNPSKNSVNWGYPLVVNELRGLEILGLTYGEVAQWLGHWIADRKVSISSPALPTVLRVRDISNLSSHTVHSAECTGNCA